MHASDPSGVSDAAACPPPGTPAPGRPLGPGAAVALVVGLFGAWFGCLAWGRVQAEPGLWGAFLAAGLGLAAWIGALLLRARRAGRPLTLEWSFRRHHLIQVLVQGSIYLYWGWHWEPVAAQAPLILAQLVFAWLFDLALSWQRYGNFRVGLGPGPIIGSTNLFLWFRDPLYGLQLAMIASMYLAREYLKWQRGGQRTHIFNPSAFGLTLAATALIVTQTVHLSWGEIISESLGYGSMAFEQMFLAACVSQLFFGVTVVPISAALTLVGLGQLYYWITGAWFFVDTSIPIAVFLSLNLLITDPVSSPRSDGGKALFGLLYGVGVMALFVGLRLVERLPSDTDPGLTAAFFDKLLHVPALNLMARWLDRVGARLPVERLTGRLQGLGKRAAHVGAWGAVFLLIRPSLVAHPGRSAEVWRTACIEGRPFACDNLLRVVASPCAAGSQDACFDLGIVYDEGRVGAPDPQLARGLWARNCQSGHLKSCLHWGEHVMADGAADGTHALRAFGQACSLGAARGCTLAGMVLLSGRAGAPDPTAAEARLTQGCEGRDGLGCSQLGMALIRARQPAEALPRFKQACSFGELPGCAQAGDMLRMLREPAFEEAAPLYRTGCDGDFAPACAALAELTAAGQGVTADAAEAAALRAKACRLGLRELCD